MVASAFFFIATSSFWYGPLLPPTTKDKERYPFSKVPTQELMIYRRSHVAWAHTAHHDFFNFMSGEPKQRNIFFLFCVNLLSREPTQPITIFLLHVRWAHTAQHFFFLFLCVNLISRESTQRITILQMSRYTSPHSASQFTNDRWGWSTPTTSCQTYNLSIRKPIQWIQITIKGMFWTYKKQEKEKNLTLW